VRLREVSTPNLGESYDEDDNSTPTCSDGEVGQTAKISHFTVDMTDGR